MARPARPYDLEEAVIRYSQEGWSLSRLARHYHVSKPRLTKDLERLGACESTKLKRYIDSPYEYLAAGILMRSFTDWNDITEGRLPTDFDGDSAAEALALLRFFYSPPFECLCAELFPNANPLCILHQHNIPLPVKKPIPCTSVSRMIYLQESK